MRAEKVDLKDLSPGELEEFIASFGKERYRSIQILRWLYQRGVHSFDEMTNLSKKFRQALDQISFISTLSSPPGGGEQGWDEKVSFSA